MKYISRHLEDYFVPCVGHGGLGQSEAMAMHRVEGFEVPLVEGVHLHDPLMGWMWKMVNEREPHGEKRECLKATGTRKSAVTRGGEGRWPLQVPFPLPVGQWGRAIRCAPLLTSFCSAWVIASDRSQGGIPRKNGCKGFANMKPPINVR